MQIVINHLTRMQRGYVCAAGIELETMRHIRPVRVGVRLKAEILARYRGPFDMGHIIELGPARPVPERPEIEDHEPPDWERVRLMGRVSPEEFWEMNEKVAKRTLREIFGRDLRMRGMRAAGIDPGGGEASLGCLIPTGRPRLFIKSRPPMPDQVRIAFGDGKVQVDVGLTDIRLYGADHVTPNLDLIDQVAARLKSGEQVILAVGVGRAIASEDGAEAVHWLQANNIHFNDGRVWRLD